MWAEVADARGRSESEREREGQRLWSSLLVLCGREGRREEEKRRRGMKRQTFVDRL